MASNSPHLGVTGTSPYKRPGTLGRTRQIEIATIPAPIRSKHDQSTEDTVRLLIYQAREDYPTKWLLEPDVQLPQDTDKVGADMFQKILEQSLDLIILAPLIGRIYFR